MNEPETELLQAAPLGMQSFIRVTDYDNGDVLVNVGEIVAVFSIMGRAQQQYPGAQSRLMLRPSVNIPVMASIDQIEALLAQAALVVSGEVVEETGTQNAPRIYAPGDAR